MTTETPTADYRLVRRAANDDAYFVVLQRRWTLFTPARYFGPDKIADEIYAHEWRDVPEGEE